MTVDGRKNAIVTLVLVALGVAAVILSNRLEPEYPTLVEVGAVIVFASLIATWWARGDYPVLSRYALALAFAGLVPIVVGLVPEHAATAKVPEPPARVTALYVTLRSSMFTGFLTLGGFLLSLKTFIVVKMKEGVFDNELHIKKILANQARQDRRAAQDARDRDDEGEDAPVTNKPRKRFRYYGELDRLRRLLFGAICFALTCSISQVTIGLIESVRSSTYCFAIAAFEIGVLVQVLVVINHNLHDWFDTLEADAEKKLKKAKSDAAKLKADADAAKLKADAVAKAEEEARAAEQAAADAKSKLDKLKIDAGKPES